MGRGPRRYLPPGPINNQELLDHWKDAKINLTKPNDYR